MQIEVYIDFGEKYICQSEIDTSVSYLVFEVYSLRLQTLVISELHITGKVHHSILLLRAGVLVTNHGKTSNILMIQVSVASIIRYQSSWHSKLVFYVQGFV
jgi:hypothetical protein